MLETFNDRAVSWANIKLTVNVQGGPTLDNIVDIKSIKTGVKVDRGEQRGASGGRVRKFTDGSVTNSISATFYTEGLEVLETELVRAAIAAGFVDEQGRPQISKVTFDWVIQHDFKDDSTIRTRKINGCRMSGEDHSDEEGNDAKTIDVEMACREIVKVVDGKDVVML